MIVLNEILATVDLLLQATPSGSKTADKLVIADKAFMKEESDKRDVLLYAKLILGMPIDLNAKTQPPKHIIWVKNEKQLSRAIRSFDRINHLTIYMHGIRGALLFDSHSVDVDAIFSSDEIEAGLPEVRNIDIVGCNVGREAVRVLRFARQLKATTVTAWNHFRVTYNQGYEGQRGSSDFANTIQEFIDAAGLYVLPGTPEADELAAQSKRVFIGLEWFRIDLDDTMLPLSTDEWQTRRRDFKARSDAIMTFVITEADAEALDSEHSSDPLPPLRQIVVQPD